MSTVLLHRWFTGLKKEGAIYTVALFVEQLTWFHSLLVCKDAAQQY